MPYTNYNMQYVAPYSLDVVDKVLNGLQQKHENTIEKASALKATIANLDLNEAESEYREGLIQNIENTINANTVNGFKGYAYDDILKITGDLASDKGLLGRLNAQKEYKSFTEAVDKSTEFGQDIKDWSKDVNKYYYDENNNGKWTPIVNPTKQIDMNTIFAIAKQYIIPQEGKYSQIRYYNADGSISNTFDPNGTINVFDTISGQWERVSEQQVKDGLEAAMKGSPEIRASLQQDYEVAKWKDAKTKNDEDYSLNQALYNNDGTMKTLQEFTEDRFNPFIRTQTYYHNFTQTTPNVSLFSNTNKNNSSNSKSGNDGIIPYVDLSKTTITNPGNGVAYKNTDYSDAQHSVFEINGIIRQQLTNNPVFKNKSINYNKIDINDIQGSINYLREQMKTNPAITEDFINNFQEELENIYNNNYASIALNNEIAQKHPEKLSAFRLRNNITNGDPVSMNDADISEKDKKEYGAKIDKVFFHGNIVNAFKNENEYRNVLAELEEQGFNNNIIKGKFKDGTYYIGLDKENSNLLIPFINAVNNNVTKNNFGRIFDEKFTKKSYGGVKGDMNPDGKTSIEAQINRFIKYYDKLNEESIIPEEELYQSTTIVPGATPVAAQMLNLAANPTIENQDRTAALKVVDTINEQVTDLFKVADYTKLGLEKYNDENGVYSKLTTKEQKELQSAIMGSSPNYKVSITSLILDDEQQWQIQFNVAPTKDADKNKPFTVITTSKNLEKYIPAIAEYNNNSDVAVSRTINKSISSGIPIDIGYEKGKNITNHYQLKSAGNETFDVLSNGEMIGTINKDAASGFVKIYNEIKQYAPYIKQGLMTNDDATKLVNNWKTQLSLLQFNCGIPIFSKELEDSIIDMIGLK